MKRVIAAVLLLATVAGAQTTEKKAEQGRKTTIVFDPDEIGGDRETPLIDEVYVANRRPAGPR